MPLPLQLPIAEAAAHLGISAATVRRRIKRGELRARRRALPGGYQLLVELAAPAPPAGAAAGAGSAFESVDPEPAEGAAEPPPRGLDRADRPAEPVPPAGPVERLEALVDELRRRADDQAAELGRVHARLAAVEADARAERDAHHKQLAAALTLLGHRLALEAGGGVLGAPVVDVGPVEPPTRPVEGGAHEPAEGATQTTAVGVEGLEQDVPAVAQGAPQSAQGVVQDAAQGTLQDAVAQGGTDEGPGWWRRVLAWLRG